MHGGKSLAGIAHPNYKHGLYSKHCILGRMLRAEIKEAKRREKLEIKIARILESDRAAREAKAQKPQPRAVRHGTRKLS